MEVSLNTASESLVELAGQSRLRSGYRYVEGAVEGRSRRVRNTVEDQMGLRIF